MIRIPRALRGVVAPVAVGLVGVAACALQVMIFGKPIPSIHDEFSYLLAADTFLHGRCANPTPPSWPEFETFHELMRPNYASKYPPGQGLFLAAGWLIGGHPIVGVWLGIGLACGATTWMLRAFVPRWWAVLGGVLMASRLGFGEWGWFYMGGGVATAGGALFIGGWVRVLNRQHPAPAIVMAIGLALLAVTRPFEGIVLCLPVGLATIAWIVRKQIPRAVLLRRLAVPALAILVPAGVALGYYNDRVTGSPFRLPYLEYAAQYDIAPALIVQKPYAEPRYRHFEFYVFHHDVEYGDYLSLRSPEKLPESIRRRFLMWWRIFIGYGLSLALLGLPYALLLSRRTRFASAACVFVLGVIASLETWGFPHYTAPVVPLVFLLVVQGFRCIALYSFARRPVLRWFGVVWLSGCLLASDRTTGISDPRKNNQLCVGAPDRRIGRRVAQVVDPPDSAPIGAISGNARL